MLGSLPSRRSIAEQQYYAHPQNAFWPIMREIFGIDGSYEDRCNQLVDHRVALWDVLASSERPGSMDADIRLDSARANDFDDFLVAHPDLRLIAFNGRTAQQLFQKLVNIQTINASMRQVVMPSTSPAYAAMPFLGKLDAWRESILVSASEQLARRGR